MSHFTSIQTQIKDLDALADACKELGVELVLGGEARGYAGQTRKGEAVVKRDLYGIYNLLARTDYKVEESNAVALAQNVATS